MRLKPRGEGFRQSLGSRGERLAWHYLEANGYRVVERNYRCKAGEVDIIAEQRETLVFVEVKTRRTHRFGRPEEAVFGTKQRKLVQVAEWYLSEKKMHGRSMRFDVLAITWPEQQEPQYYLIQNSFDAEGFKYDGET